MWGKWWVYDPGILLRDGTLWPNENQSLPEQLNALTRCLVIVVLILVILQYYKAAWITLLVGVIIILVVGYQMQASSRPRPYDIESGTTVPAQAPPDATGTGRPIISYMQVVAPTPARVLRDPVVSFRKQWPQWSNDYPTPIEANTFSAADSQWWNQIQPPAEIAVQGWRRE